MKHKYTGIILRKKDIGEADRIYTIYTLEAGKIQAKAVGIRKLGAKLAGSLEGFILADLNIVKKNGIGKITSSIIEESFLNLHSNLDLILLAKRVIGIFENFVGLNEKDENIFKLLWNYLSAMNKTSGDGFRAEVVSAGFLFQLLKFSGYEIKIGKCLVCGERIKNTTNLFSLEKGGIVCSHCLVPDKNHMLINPYGIKLLHLIANNKISSLLKVKIEETEARKVRKIMEIFCQRIIS